MARVTVEDCIVKIPNRFKLVMMAAQRSRELSVGGELTIDRDNDKNPVVALREIADVTIDIDGLENSLIQALQKNIEVDLPIDDSEEFFAVEEALSEIAGFGASPEAATDEAGERTGPDMGVGFDDEPGLDNDQPG